MIKCDAHNPLHVAPHTKAFLKFQETHFAIKPTNASEDSKPIIFSVFHQLTQHYKFLRGITSLPPCFPLSSILLLIISFHTKRYSILSLLHSLLAMKTTQKSSILLSLYLPPTNPQSLSFPTTLLYLSPDHVMHHSYVVYCYVNWSC